MADDPARRDHAGRANPAKSLALLLVLAAAAVLPGWLPGRVYQSVDALNAFAPWRDNNAAQFAARNLTMGDHARQFVPWMMLSVDALRDGRIPLWNPHQQLGVPLLGNGQSAVFYPTTYLHLVLPPTWSWTISAVLRLWVAGIGVWLLAGRYGLSPFARLFSAAVFMLCGFCMAWVNHPLMYVMPWLGWCVFAMEELAARPSLPRFLLAALVLAVQFLGGHPESSVHILLTCSMVFFLRAGLIDGWPMLRRIPLLLAALGLALALAAAALGPMLEYVLASAAFAYRSATGASVHPPTWQFLAGVFFPYFGGFPPDQYRLFPSTYNTPGLAGGFVGTLPIVLSIFALVRRRRQRQRWVWAGVAIMSLALASELPGVSHLIAMIPGLKTIEVGRQMIGVALALSMLSGLGIDALAESIRSQQPLLSWRRAAIVLAICISSASFISLAVAARSRDQYMRPIERRARSTAARANGTYPPTYFRNMATSMHASLLRLLWRLQIPAVSLALTYALLRRQGRGGFAPAPWLALASLELLAFGIFYQPGSAAQDYFPSRPSLDFLRARQQRDPPFRVYGAPGAFPPDTASAYRLDDVSGYDAVVSRRVSEFLKAVTDRPRVSRDLIPPLLDLTAPALRLLNLRFAMLPPGAAPPGEPWVRRYPRRGRSVDADAAVYENPLALPRVWAARAALRLPASEILPRVKRFDFDPRELVLLEALDGTRETTPPATAPTARPQPRIVLYQPQRIIVSIPKGADPWIVLADGFFPGWQASIRTGSARREAIIEPAYGVLRAVYVPQSAAEAARLELRYQPRAWRWGMRLSLVAAALLALLVAAGPMRSRPL